MNNVEKPPARAYWYAAADDRLAHLKGVSPQGDVKYIASARDTVDDEIEAARLAVCAMRTRRNALAPISVLPPEILARIFELHAIDCPHGKVDYYRADRMNLRFGWIASATHVCRRWREVALDHPRLWGRLAFNMGSKWVEEMLARVKAAPIFVSQKLPYCSPPTTGTVTLMHPAIPSRLSQVQELNFSGYLEHMLPLLTRPAPMLERLELSTDVDMTTQVSIPINFLDNHAPRLREIELRNVSHAWGVFPSRALTELKIAFSINPIPTSFAQFLDFLEGTPTLTKLTLECCIPSASHFINDRVVSLPNMSALTLAGPTTDVIGVLTHISVATSTKLGLSCSSQDLTGDECCNVLPLIMAHLGTNSSRPSSIRMFSLHSVDISTHIMKACRDEITQEGRPVFILEEGVPDVSLRLQCRISTDEREASFLHRICGAFPLRDVRALDVNILHSHCPDLNWVDMFGHCTSLRHLCVSYIPAETLCVALGRPTVEVKQQEHGKNARRKRRAKGPLLFPSLQTLYLHEVNFEIPERYSGDLYAALRSSLKTRLTRKAGLRVLEIEECTVDEDQIEQFEDVVDEVVWDGEVGEMEEEYEEEFADEYYGYGYEEDEFGYDSEDVDVFPW
ncbi:hypothetical protein BV25DRAFT_1992747 [Artomyces pyxidatus]|uniref:Uncharacterized protein n=1 Tax=Artomyces pyxidatus TaxID=48021 RepID=A0ACB8SXV5_9AGAM|nr:hypothetical protein BV25DRAFT_1992747 [Artomyces pyxidatus]